MSLALDANVLLYAVNTRDSRHERSREVLAELAEGREVVYLFWPVLTAFLRISTRVGVFSKPLSPAEARRAVDELLENEHFYSPGESESFWSAFRETAAEVDAKGDLVSDTHIVALMRVHGVRTIITHDRDFRRFDGIKVRDPFA
ncbi:MAG TPA: TA system VapC family ribonuclease toxin [Solirubrobacteraceae bacterium]|nr:TA system VapC family ribonuclease toxin [Solirubrobacteraceae bacterium]